MTEAKRIFYPLEFWIVLGITLLAALLRFLFLGLRPVHFDEGTYGILVDGITTQGFYNYNPSFFHGPLHFYILFFFKTLFGRSILAFRYPAAFISTLCVFLICLFDRFIGRRVAYSAALAMAVSPAMVFYGRYPFQDTELVLFYLMQVWGFLGLWNTGRSLYLWPIGLGVAGMVLAKETYIIHVASVVVAAAYLKLSQRFFPVISSPHVGQSWTKKELGTVCGVSLLLIVFFYSHTFYSFSSLKDLFLAFRKWGAIGIEGQGHIKPFYYWLNLIFFNELPVIAGLFVSVALLWKTTTPFLRFIAAYSLVNLIIYSVIPYKTPWCVVTIIWPFFFLFGAGIRAFSEWKGRYLAYSFAGVLLMASLVMAIRLTFYHDTDVSQKYVYVQTTREVYRFLNPLNQFLAQSPANYHIKGTFIYPKSWPFPWILGDMTRIGYYEEMPETENLDTNFLVVAPNYIAETEKRLRKPYYTVSFTVIPNYGVVKAYFDAKVFKSVFPDLKPDFDPGKKDPS